MEAPPLELGKKTVSMNRVWAMPNADTFSVPPIGEFVKKYLARSKVSIDPFARNKRWATHTNDLNPGTAAEHHMDAEEFCRMLEVRGVKADLVVFDPPYSPTQMRVAYQHVGLTRDGSGTRNSELYRRVRDAVMPLLLPGAVVLSFGWSSAGMGVKRGFTQEEILLVCHGGAHNDTICLAERKTP